MDNIALILLLVAWMKKIIRNEIRTFSPTGPGVPRGPSGPGGP